MSAAGPGPRVLDVPVDWTVPAFGKKVVPAGGRVEVTGSEDTLTTYDTAAGDLAGVVGLPIALSRGSGADAVWTLTVDGTTSEFPVVGRGVPAEIRDVLLGVRAGAALRASGKAEVQRVTHRVLDAEGVEVGTITDVRIRSAAVGTAAAGGSAGVGTAALRETRHVEVAGWDGPFVDAAVRRLRKSGAEPVSQVTDVDGPEHPGETGGDLPDAAAGDTVGAAVVGFLRSQRAALLSADLDLRRGEDTIHPFRVAIRRIRSALRVVGVAETEAWTSLDEELRWLAGVLGAVRDNQVLREHLRSSLDDLHAREDVDLVATDAALQVALDRDEAASGAALRTALAGRRYLALLRTLRDWTVAPPFTTAGDEPEQRLARYVKAAAKELDRKLAKAGGSADKLHRARKAAKRARYVASFAGESAGKHGPQVVKRAKSLQTALGDHQDCMVAADYVARVAADTDGAAAFGCGVLWVHEQERADEALRRARRAQEA